MIDTRNRRAACLAIGHNLPHPLLPNPDGTIDEPDRQQLCWLYPGILSGLLVVPGIVNYVGRVLVGPNQVGRSA